MRLRLLLFIMFAAASVQAAVTNKQDYVKANYFIGNGSLLTGVLTNDYAGTIIANAFKVPQAQIGAMSSPVGSMLGLDSSGNVVVSAATGWSLDGLNGSLGPLVSVAGPMVTTNGGNPAVTYNGGRLTNLAIILPLVAVPISSGTIGCQLSSDGTNLFLVFKNSVGTLTTNKATLSSYP
jgi:hypothetical protein